MTSHLGNLVLNGDSTLVLEHTQSKVAASYKKSDLSSFGFKLTGGPDDANQQRE